VVQAALLEHLVHRELLEVVVRLVHQELLELLELVV
jgi:hypothetical protein